MEETNWYSWKTGNLCEGCKLCVEGQKLVLFITGLCAQRCFYCPVSEHKFGRDVVFANEWKIANPEDPKELFEEVRLTNARGAGITGGDPLAVTERCCTYIKLLKEKFGKDFHIHLYTPLKLVTEERLRKIYNAGLDEIRFHPDLDDNSLWKNLELAKKFSWTIGIEIPAIPGKETQTKKIVDFFADKINFINLNELELSDTKIPHYNLDKYKQKNDISYGVKGSKELALKLLTYAKEKGVSAHFCTEKLKNAVQLRNRLLARAKNIALVFDKVTEEGTLIRGCAYLKELAPGIGYNQSFKTADKAATIQKLEKTRNKLIEHNFNASEIVIDKEKLRLIIPQNTAKYRAKILKKFNLTPTIVEEYPTADSMEVEIDFL